MDLASQVNELCCVTLQTHVELRHQTCHPWLLISLIAQRRVRRLFACNTMQKVNLQTSVLSTPRSVIVQGKSYLYPNRLLCATPAQMNMHANELGQCHFKLLWFAHYTFFFQVLLVR